MQLTSLNLIEEVIYIDQKNCCLIWFSFSIYQCGCSRHIDDLSQVSISILARFQGSRNVCWLLLVRILKYWTECMNLRIGNPHLHAWSSLMSMRLSLEGASAFLWALQVADTENWMQIVIEGDAKVCVDGLNGKGERVD